MPLIKYRKIGDESAWALWKITESCSELISFLQHEETAALLDNIQHVTKKEESLAGRLVVKYLLETEKETFCGVYNNEHGKPCLFNYNYHISISHSYPYAAAIIHKNKAIGIDIEEARSSLLKVSAKFLSEEERQDAGEDLKKLCIYWCAKETLYKVYERRKLVFKENLKVAAFAAGTEGVLQTMIDTDNFVQEYRLQYEAIDNLVICYTL